MFIVRLHTCICLPQQLIAYSHEKAKVETTIKVSWGVVTTFTPIIKVNYLRMTSLLLSGLQLTIWYVVWQLRKIYIHGQLFEYILQHFEKIISSLREELDEKDQELDRLRHENSAVVQSEAESSQALEKFEKIMIHEINEECKKTADLLGVQPRKAQTVS